MNAIKLFTLLSLLSLTSKSFAQEIKEAWVKKPMMSMTAAYMKIYNPSDKPIKLLKVEGPDAKYYEIHTHKKENGVMKMRQLKELVIAPHETAELKPMHDHIMLLEIPMKKVKNISGKLKLTFDNGKVIEITPPVRKP